MPGPRRLLPPLLLAWTLSAASLAQGGHPVAPSPIRPLQERVGAADVVLIGEVVALSEGRIDVEARNVLRGAPPDRFLVKRGRSAPPPLAAGDRAVLLLRGARPPYVLVDEPAETVRLVDAPGEEAWRSAVEAALSLRDDPTALADRMTRWIDAGPASLRDVAGLSLRPLLAADEVLSGRIALERAEAAARSDLPAEARALSAQLAAASPEGQDRLVATLTRAEHLDPSALALALRTGSIRGHADLAALYERALDSRDPELRRIAARDPAPVLRLGADAEARLQGLVNGDPEETVKRAAEETLGRVRRAREAGRLGATAE